jgi:hypothetical protein
MLQHSAFFDYSHALLENFFQQNTQKTKPRTEAKTETAGVGEEQWHYAAQSPAK